MSLKGVFVMKKILCLLVLLLSLTATCAAFNPPQPPRWYWINVRLYGWNGITQIKMNILFRMMNMILTAE